MSGPAPRWGASDMPAKPRSGIGAKMAGGNPDPLRGREARDFYPTPPAVTRALYRRYEPILSKTTVWEPCAGDGAIVRALVDAGVPRVVGSDIEPLHPGIATLDVFAQKSLPSKIGAVVTNPPFEIAAQIIQHIQTMQGGPPHMMALVLKATFWHARSRAPLFAAHRPAAIHPLRWRPDFKGLGAPTMDVMWCVWLKGGGPITRYEPMDYPE